MQGIGEEKRGKKKNHTEIGKHHEEKAKTLFYSLVIDNPKFCKKKNQTKQRKSKAQFYTNDSQAQWV